MVGLSNQTLDRSVSGIDFLDILDLLVYTDTKFESFLNFSDVFQVGLRNVPNVDIVECRGYLSLPLVVLQSARVPRCMERQRNRHTLSLNVSRTMSPLLRRS